MEKVILVFDKPKSCSNCRFCQYDYEGRRICAAEDTSDHGVHTSIQENYYSDTKPNWCPLKPLPEEKHRDTRFDDIARALDYGWNSCLAALEGKDMVDKLIEHADRILEKEY